MLNDDNAVPTVESVTLEPNWDGMRRWLRALARTDLAHALQVADGMGCEAPDLSDFGAPSPRTWPCGCATRNGFPVRRCARPDDCNVSTI